MFTLRLCVCMCVSAVWTDGLSKQYAVEVADLALGVCSGGRPGHQPQQPHLHVSLKSSSCYLFMPEHKQAINLKHFGNLLCFTW